MTLEEETAIVVTKVIMVPFYGFCQDNMMKP